METQIEPPAGGRSPVIPIAIVAVIVAAVSAAVIFFVVNGSSDTAFDPIAVAELAPEDAHFFMALNTDFASAPWESMPRLLDALGIEQQVRDDLAESAEDEGFEFEDEIVPALATISRAGVAAQYSPDGGEYVVFIDSRDADRVRDVLLRNMQLEDETRDDELGIDFERYVDNDDPFSSPSYLGTHEGVMYLGDSAEHIANFIRRRETGSPLSESERFRDSLEGLTEDALLVGYVNGNLLDHRDFRDVVDGLVEAAEIDPRDGSVAFAVTARSNGFGARAVVRLESGLGTAAATYAEPADLSGIANITPDDTIFLVAGSGLHDALLEAFENVESDPMFQDTLTPFEDMSGMSFKEDLLPLFASSFAIAVGGDGISSDLSGTDDIWLLTLIESIDPARLQERLDQLTAQLEFFICDCDSGVRVAEEGAYVSIRWPDATLSDATLAQDPGFIATLELLPPDPAALFFLNIGALPEETISEASANFAADPDGYDIDLGALHGFAVSTHGDDTSISIDLVLPIDVAQE